METYQREGLSMKAILYISEATTIFDSEMLIELARNAHSSNKENGVTGFLYFHDSFFLQYIEGAESSVSHLFFSLIKGDSRHQVLASIAETTNVRRFPDWGMKLLQESDIHNVPLDYFLLNFFKRYKEDNLSRWQQEIWPMVDKLSSLRKSANLAC